jgi:hypothetical protein
MSDAPERIWTADWIASRPSSGMPIWSGPSTEYIRADLHEAEVAGHITEPGEPGGFVGDVYFGHSVKTTMGTHRWDGSEWKVLPSDLEVTLALLASARADVARLTAEVERLWGVLERVMYLLDEGLMGRGITRFALQGEKP